MTSVYNLIQQQMKYCLKSLVKCLTHKKLFGKENIFPKTIIKGDIKLNDSDWKFVMLRGFFLKMQINIQNEITLILKCWAFVV